MDSARFFHVKSCTGEVHVPSLQTVTNSAPNALLKRDVTNWTMVVQNSYHSPRFKTNKNQNLIKSVSLSQRLLLYKNINKGNINN